MIELERMMALKCRRDFVIELYEEVLQCDSSSRLSCGPPDVSPCLYLYRLGGLVVVADDYSVIESFKDAAELQVWLDEVGDPMFEGCERIPC